ncbi:MAG: NAD(P)/FAD-dependent oxidoreductase [Pseudomonadota bacterium]
MKEAPVAEHLPMVIIGAGFGGIGIAVKLREAGIQDFTILERTADLGGTWSRNTYPGAACDVPSTLYSFSFAPNPDWSRKYGTQTEILAYLRNTAETHDIVRHMRFGVEVLNARFDEAGQRWLIETDQGLITADMLISAAGPFAEAAIPDLPGLASFEGAQFHSLHWDHAHELSNERVAVIGTGASAVQFIPEIQPRVSKLLVFQRTPAWIVPRMDRAISRLEQLAYRTLPAAQRLARSSWYAMIESFGLPGFVSTKFRHPFEALGRLQLRRQVPDIKLRKMLTPNYMIGCKRAIFSDSYYPALSQPNVQVISEGIAEVRSHSIVTRDGHEHAVDTIIWGTGFTIMARIAEHIMGVDGHTMAERYRERPQSYFGTTNAGFPNMFTILGPFSTAGNQSAIFMMECQFTYILDAITRIRREGITRFEVRREAQDAFVDEMHARSDRGTRLNGGCNSYYTNSKGMNAGLYPSWSMEYLRRTQRWDVENYDLQGHAEAAR